MNRKILLSFKIVYPLKYPSITQILVKINVEITEPYEI